MEMILARLGLKLVNCAEVMDYCLVAMGRATLVWCYTMHWAGLISLSATCLCRGSGDIKLFRDVIKGDYSTVSVGEHIQILNKTL